MTSIPASRLLVASGPLLLLLGGCGDSFLPASVLGELRVLAVQASPLEAGPGDRVELRAVLHLPEGQRLVSERWSFCPFSAGSTTAYRCAVPECLTELEATDDGSVSARPLELAAACAARLASGGEAAGIAATGGGLPEQVDGVFLATHRSSTGTERQSALRFPLWLQGPPPSRNRAPVISEVSLDGEPLAAGGAALSLPAGAEAELRVQVDPHSLDQYLDTAGRQRTEEPLVSFFTTAGRVSADTEAGADVRVRLELRELSAGDTQALLYAVVRDGRGGQAVAGPFSLEIRR